MTQGKDQRLEVLGLILRRIDLFSRYILRRPLREYQLAPARAIVESVLGRRGRTLAVVMSRQAGKNELSAQVEAYLLALHMNLGGTLVKAAPTFAPQATVSLERLAALLENPLTRGRAVRKHGNALEVGKARAVFLSAHQEANVVGQTASLLLECDEAQDVDADKWDKDFAPMGASANVTTVFYGTAWTRHTLLARAVRELGAQEARDGVRRVFWVPAPVVAEEVPAYAAHVGKEVERLGRNHPLIRTQYFLEELDAEAGMFPPERRALMQGQHPPHETPQPDCAYAFLLDFGGPSSSPWEDAYTLPLFPAGGVSPSFSQGEGLSRLQCRPRSRDATALTVVAVDEDDAVSLPVYRVVHRRAWVGIDHRTLYGQLVALAEAWDPVAIVADATGVGAGLTDLLRSRLGQRVIPVTFTAARKSDIGWRFLAACDAGRFRDHARTEDALQSQFWAQVEAAEVEYLPGPGQRIRWSVPEAAGHDDVLVSAALCVVLDEAEWGSGGSIVVRP